MNSAFCVRTASQSEFEIAIQWAQKEGWNPGLDDLEAFYSADPDGFLMGWLGDRPVSAISVVRYQKNFAFLGFYLVHPEYRGAGYGLATWSAGMAHLQNRTICLDGVLDQQSNYKKNGFEYITQNIRFTGIPRRDNWEENLYEIIELTTANLPAVFALDQQCFPSPRENFIQEWVLPNAVKTRLSKGIVKDGRLIGFGTIRQCNSGFKIGPLFCETDGAAHALVKALISTVSPSAEISVDIPLCNTAAVKLAECLNLTPQFETARMVCGPAPTIAWNQVYGITSLELG